MRFLTRAAIDDGSTRLCPKRFLNVREGKLLAPPGGWNCRGETLRTTSHQLLRHADDGCGRRLIAAQCVAIAERDRKGPAVYLDLQGGLTAGRAPVDLH